jgi:polyadenylate-binding protein
MLNSPVKRVEARILTARFRTTDDDALRAKVDEAMNVYDEYIKNQGGPTGPDETSAQPNGGPENLHPGGEEGKEQEA